jgi:hypothetical protein
MILVRLLVILPLMSPVALTNVKAVGALPALLPDFTGTWEIDRDHSTAQALKDFDDLIFVILQNPPEFHVKRIIKEKKHRERISELTLFSDGRGEKISFLFGGEKWNSKTNWVGDTLVSRFTVAGYISASSDFYYRDYQETWLLSQDRTTLTITTEITVRNVPNSYRNIFRSETYNKVFHKIQ